MNLTARQQKFIAAVAGGATATDAYRGAYNAKNMNAKSVAKEAKRLLKHKSISPLLYPRTPEGYSVTAVESAPLVQKIQETVLINLERTIFENAAVAHSDIRRLFNPETGEMLQPHEWDNDTARAVKKIKVRALFGEGKDGVGQIGTVAEVELWDKGAALDRLMKHFGGYDEPPKKDAFKDFTPEEVREYYKLLQAQAQAEGIFKEATT
jgi:hypothetical protein